MNIKNLKEPWVMILIGVPMSGKDFFINNTPNLGNPIVISRDQILLDVHGSDDYNLAFKSVNQKVVDENLRKSLIDAGNSTENVIFSSETLHHPAGPAIINEWHSSGDGRIIQLEIKNAKSSQMLVERLKLIYQNNVGWRIEDLNGDTKLKIDFKAINGDKPLFLKINNHHIF